MPPSPDSSADYLLELVAIVDVETAAALRRVATEALTNPSPELHLAMAAAMQREIERQRALDTRVSKLVTTVLEDILRDPT